MGCSTTPHPEPEVPAGGPIAARTPLHTRGRAPWRGSAALPRPKCRLPSSVCIVLTSPSSGPSPGRKQRRGRMKGVCSLLLHSSPDSEEDEQLPGGWELTPRWHGSGRGSHGDPGGSGTAEHPQGPWSTSAEFLGVQAVSSQLCAPQSSRSFPPQIPVAPGAVQPGRVPPRGHGVPAGAVPALPKLPFASNDAGRQGRMRDLVSHLLQPLAQGNSQGFCWARLQQGRGPGSSPPAGASRSLLPRSQHPAPWSILLSCADSRRQPLCSCSGYKNNPLPRLQAQRGLSKP